MAISLTINSLSSNYYVDSKIYSSYNKSNQENNSDYRSNFSESEYSLSENKSIEHKIKLENSVS